MVKNAPATERHAPTRRCRKGMKNSNMTELYFVRHAQTSGNRQRSFQGRTDADLSPQGEQQLERLAERFASIALDVVYTSPLTRARKTAHAVNRHHGKEIVVENDLVEIDAGDLEGMPFAEVFAKYPDAADRFIHQPHCFAMPGGESMVQVYERMEQAVGRIIKENQGRRVAVVSHGCALQNYLASVLGYGQTGIANAPICYNTAVTHIRFTASGLPFVVVLNDASHLDAELLADSKWELKP